MRLLDAVRAKKEGKVEPQDAGATTTKQVRALASKTLALL